MAITKFSSTLKDIISGKVDIEDLSVDKNNYILTAEKLINDKLKLSSDEIKAFIKICLNYYYYSTTGSVLIPDSIYDSVMEVYRCMGNNTIIYPDIIKGDKTQWDFIDHKHPGLVGTIAKVYEYEELRDWFNMYNVHGFTLSPKFDGVSCVIQVSNGKIVSGATRYNGLQGQNITDLVQRAYNSVEFKAYPDGYYKCELVVSSSNFELLIAEKEYKNRRSATTGIVNTPKNVSFGRYITIIPLARLAEGDNGIEISFNTKDSEDVLLYSARDLYDYVEAKLQKLRENYDYRIDGIVITPKTTTRYNSIGDIYEESIAYKLNTAEAKTTIVYGYMDVGRLGGATPMLKVKPVEVNETTVTDVSLGSYANFLKMGLLVNEEIIVYSAGDVIPQVKPLNNRHNIYNLPYLDIERVCPYCGEKLTRISTEYVCANDDCVRVKSGIIANFADKMGIMGFSDETFATLYEANIIKSIKDLIEVELHVREIKLLEGFGDTSIDNLVDEVNKLKNTPVTISNLIGSLGIPNISSKKCRKIFDVVNIDDLLRESNPYKLLPLMVSAQGIGRVTADIFIEYISKNKELVEFLYSNLNIINDINYKGTIVFTGFRNADYERRFNDLGYSVSETLTRSVMALIYTNSSVGKTKYLTAMKYEIPLISYNDIEEFMDTLN